MRKLFFIVLSAIALAACSTMAPAVNQRVATDLQALEFNSVASQYMERPTFVSLVRFDGKEPMLSIERDNYSSASYSTTLNYPNVQSDKSYLSISPEAAIELQPMLDKYREWREIAVADGDMIEKDIGQVSSPQGGRIELSFFSGNENNHYLVATFCMMACLHDSAFYFDAENVESLDLLLERFAADEIQPVDLDSKYN